MSDRAVRAAWLALWRAMRVWNRYDVRGFEHLEGGRAALLVAYHGRPIAWDQCMLTSYIHERLGYLPHGVIHGAFGATPALQRCLDALGFVTGDGPAIERAVACGEHVMVQPGGTREGCRSFHARHRVEWGERTGYLRLAIRHRLPIVPVAGRGVDDGFVGLNDGHALGKLLGVPGRVPVWLGVGVGVWPLALPLPVAMTTVIGAPIPFEALRDPATGRPVDGSDPAPLLRLHRRIARGIQRLLDEANAEPSRAA
ncbi:MAG: hypothetical protein U0324_15045 [Polyangiales bacterium]